MFNYYTDLKRRTELENQRKEEERKKRIYKIYESIILYLIYFLLAKKSKLLKGYQNRIENFLYEMVDKPIELKDPRKKNMSLRQELYAQEADKILSKKGFIFSRYNRPQEDCYLERTEFAQKPKKEVKHKMTQPSMRFKPRTDLERVWDTLMLFNSSINEKYKHLIDSQLASLGVNVVQREDSSIDKDESSESSDKNNKTNMNISQLSIDSNSRDFNSNNNNKESDNNKVEKKKKKRSTRDRQKEALAYREKLRNIYKIRIDNAEQKKIHSDLYNKTYFKALENYSLFKSGNIESQLDNRDSVRKRNQEIINQKYKSVDINRRTNYNNMHKNQRFSIHSIRKEKDDDEEGKRMQTVSSPVELINMLSKSNKHTEKKLFKTLENFDLFTQSPIDKTQMINRLEKEKLEQVKRLAFSNDNFPTLIQNPTTNNKIIIPDEKEEDNDTHYPKLNIRNKNFLKPEELIKIDGIEYEKNDLENLSKAILSKCRWVRKKKK